MNRSILLVAALLALPLPAALAATPGCTDAHATLHDYAPAGFSVADPHDLREAGPVVHGSNERDPDCGDDPANDAFAASPREGGGSVATATVTETSSAAPREPPGDGNARVLSAASAPSPLADGIGGILGLVLACACVLAYVLGRRVARGRTDTGRRDPATHRDPGGSLGGPSAFHASSPPRPGNAPRGEAHAAARSGPARALSHHHERVLDVVDSGPDAPGLLTRRPPDGIAHGAPP